MNSSLRMAKDLLASNGMKWLTSRFRFYAVDMNRAGPVEGSRVIVYSSITSSTKNVELTTLAPHGLAKGDVISVSHHPTQAESYQLAHVYALGRIIQTPNSPNLHRCIYDSKVQTTSVEAAWNPIYTRQPNGDWWLNLGVPKHINYMVTEKHIVEEVLTDVKIQLSIPYLLNTFFENTTAFIQPMNISYISEVGNPTSFVATSDSLLGKTLVNNKLDAADVEFPVIDASGNGHVLFLAKVADSEDDPFDLPYEQQPVIAMWDYDPSGVHLPITPITGTATVPFLNPMVSI